MFKFVAIALVLFAIPSHSLGQQAVVAESSAAPAEDEVAPGDQQGGVEFALRRYIVVFNFHDPDKLAALWTPGGVYVDKTTGERAEGRDALAEDFRALFAAAPQVTLSGEVESIRVLADEVAMVEGTTTTVTPDAEPATTAYSAIFVKQDGKWLLDAVHETPLAAPEAPRQALEPLAWMVGQWRDAGAGDEAATVDTTVRWSPSEAFLIRSYNVNREGEDPFEGTQIIGWDPRSKEIRSWTFNSDGSFGDGVWTESDGEWLVRSAQTLADGRAATATQVIKQLDDQTASVQTIAKEVEGAPEPASDPVTMTRVAEPEGEPASAGGSAPTTAEATP